jgi:hypothetical protein
MRALPLLALALTLGFAGCTPVRYRGAEERGVAHGSVTDAWMEDPGDAGMVFPENDAWVEPGHDAAVPPGHDAGIFLPDAWVAPAPDAATACGTTYNADVKPIYVQHCANCHTTGGDPHFGSSYTVANRGTSSCGTSMAECTIQLGQPGGSMAFRDPYGGFSTSEIATIQAWIDCGRPM